MHGTPSKITPEIETLCAELVKDPKPVYLDVEPAEGARQNYCFPNVEAQIAASGGSIQHGWQIWELTDLIIEAEFHAVWVDPNGVLHDITPKQEGDGRILFLPDPVRVYEGKQVNNVRRPLRDHPAVTRMIDEYDLQFEILNKGGLANEHGEITLSQDARAAAS